MNNDQIAHDLAIAYVNNRYGAEVSGYFSVSTYDGDVSGEGSVDTLRLPDVDKVRMIKVGTGERHLFGLRERKELVEAGYEVDEVFKDMLADYRRAFARFLSMLEKG